MEKSKLRLGDLLVRENLITEKQLESALAKQKSTGRKLGEILVEDDYVNARDIVKTLQIQLKIPFIDLDNISIDEELSNVVKESLARKHQLVPVKKTKTGLLVAMADPLNIFAIDDVKMMTGLKIEPAIAMKNNIEDAINRLYTEATAEKAAEDFAKQFEESLESYDKIDEVVLDDVNNAPIVQLVNTIIDQAIQTKASDIHIEPFENIVRIRYRIDGQLQTKMKPSKATHSAIVTRVKIMCNLDIAERRKPQDGRYEYTKNGAVVDLRISIIPAVFGEKIVIRLLDRSNFLVSKQQLGFTEVNYEQFDEMIHKPHGIVLVTGPTGSGKTTTLYAVLSELNDDHKNIITLEDPVEYRLDGINQVQVNPKAGLTFAGGLRSILRQDPNIIMIGEIRDTETAQIAIRAAVTGHLVISTLHTNDAPSTVSRLMDMEIEPYLLSNSLVGIVSQRLVRRICENCKEEYDISNSEKEILKTYGVHKLYKGKGCSKCYNTGYKGRVAIHEVLIMNRELKGLVEGHASSDQIRQAALKNGMIELSENCRELVLGGVTTVDEYSRVIYTME